MLFFLWKRCFGFTKDSLSARVWLKHCGRHHQHHLTFFFFLFNGPTISFKCLKWALYQIETWYEYSGGTKRYVWRPNYIKQTCHSEELTCEAQAERPDSESCTM